MKKIRCKKAILILLSFSISVCCAALLICFANIYNSHKYHKILDFSSKIVYNNGLIISDDYAYIFNEYGSDFTRSDLYSAPLLQYGGPDIEFYYYKFNNIYFGTGESLSFSPANSSEAFFCKNGRELYYIDTNTKVCTLVNNQKNITSCSLGGTYFLEENDKYIFYKFDKKSLSFTDSVEMKLQSDNYSFVCWLNDSYALIYSSTDKGDVYYIVNAHDGEALPCASILKSDKEYQKQIFSNRYFIKDTDKGEKIFDIYLQDFINFNLKAIKTDTINKISDKASYILTLEDGMYKIFSSKGLALVLNEVVDGDISNVDFICDNIIIITTLNSSYAYKVML